MRLKESTWGVDSEKMKFDSRWKRVMWGVHKAKLWLKVLRSEKNDTWPWQTRWNLVIDAWTLATLWLICWGNKLIRGIFLCALAAAIQEQPWNFARDITTWWKHAMRLCIIVSCSCKRFFCGVPEARNATCNIFFARKTWLFTREVWHATQNGQTMFIEFQHCGFYLFKGFQ